MQKKNLTLRIVTITFGLLLVIPIGVAITPQRTEAAGLPTFDALNFIKNTFTSISTAATAASTNALVIKGYTLDPLAWAIAKAVLNSVIQSTVKWINSGFQGSPAFVTNLNQTLLTTANSVATSFTQQLLSNGSIKSPFQSQVGAAVASNYNANTNGGFFTANAYTLNQTSSNPAAFLKGDITQGGLNAMFSAYENPANNPYGAQVIAQQALSAQVATAQSNQKSELNWGNGFAAYKGNCNAPSTSSTGATSLSGTNTCANANTLTPGSVLANTTYKALGSTFDQLVTASQFGQIVNALVGQLTNQVLGSGGLLGTSASSASTGSSYLNQISASQTSSVNTTASSFSATISTQISQLQSFQSQWNTLNTLALAAQTALSTSNCPTAQTSLSATVQPVLSQAATELSAASTSIATLQKIQTEASASNTTAQIAQASTDYSTLLSSSSLPSATDIQYAQAQSVDSGSNPTQTLFTQLTQLAANAQSCQVTTTPPTNT